MSNQYIYDKESRVRVKRGSCGGNSLEISTSLRAKINIKRRQYTNPELMLNAPTLNPVEEEN